MQSGRLKHKVTIQNQGTTTNDFGEVEESEWSYFNMAYASIIPISGNESFLSNTDFAKVTHKIETRYFDGLNASMRIKYGNRIFKIISVINNMEQNKKYQIKVEEVIND